MRWKSIIALPALFLGLAASAQDYVTLYQQCNYAGRSYTLAPGSYRTYQMKVANDRLASIQIPPGWKVTIYENDRYLGRSKTYYNSISCIEANFRNITSSIVVEEGEETGTGTGEDYVTFYSDCNSGGFSQSFEPGMYTGTQLGSLRYAISSFRINGNLRVKAYMNSTNVTGNPVNFETSQSCLPTAYNNKIGSVVIEHVGSTTDPGSGGVGGSGNYITLYSGCSYEGNAIRLIPGSYQGDKLGLMKYNASSIDLAPNLQVRVYLDNEYLTGSSFLIEDDITCMTTNLRNRIGSIVIEARGSTSTGGGGVTTPTDPAENVIIYADENFRGQAAYLQPGIYNSMEQAGFPDNALSSLVLPAGYRVVLYDQPNLQGSSYTVNQTKAGFLLSGWNDKTSSLAVYRN